VFVKEEQDINKRKREELMEQVREKYRKLLIRYDAEYGKVRM
jgi:hypothetical protein